MFSQILKGRHYICQLLFLCLHSYSVFSTAYSGPLPPWLSPLPKSGKQSFRFCLCSNTVSLLHCYSPLLKHHFNLRKIQRIVLLLSLSPQLSGTNVLVNSIFFFNRGGTEWPCKNDTMAVSAEYYSSMKLAFSLQELETQSCVIKLSVWKLYICFKLSVNADQQDNERM